MFDRIGRSIELAKASFRVLRSDKELLLFPFVSFLVLIVVSISFFVPFMLVGGINSASHGQTNIASYVVAFLFYVASYTVIFFFNTALVGAAMVRLDGGDPTLRDGFRIAFSHLPQILVYAVIAATVGMILRFISERAGFLGQIVAGIIGFAWNVATFLVVPVLVVEKVGPIAAIKRSGSLLRQTWGEQIVGNFGLGIIFGLLIFGILILGGVLAFLAYQVSVYLAVAVVLVMLILVGIVALVGSALSGIFTASLYRYATKGEGGQMFRTETLAGAFRQKK